MSAAEVIVVPTFRRPALLGLLLDGLLPQASARGALVIVGDNDCDDAIRDMVEGYRDRGDVHYLAVPARGVSQVRNALMAEAMAKAPDWRWLLMLDDDGQAPAGWLETIVACGEKYEADLIGGPVEGVLPDDASMLAKNSLFARRKRHPTGTVTMLNTTQNLGIARRLLDRLPLPLFDARLGASGGEDYDLFRRTFIAGGKLVWCDEAEVIEPAPPERLTTRALLSRYYTTGIYMTPIDRAYDGAVASSVVAVKGLAGAVLRTGVATVTGKSDKRAFNTLMTAHYLGRLAGVFGARSNRYVAATPTPAAAPTE